MLISLLLVAVGWVAFTNGANANFKGVASLYGSGTVSRRGAAMWGTGLTLGGSLAALFVSSGLLAAFSGRGLVPDTVATDTNFLVAVALGAAGTSFLANRLGFPVSTTHALVGALVGAGLAGSGGVELTALGKVFVYPLVVSPVLAALAGGLTYHVFRRVRLAPDQRSRPLDVAHYLSAGAASFARGLNDTPKIAAPLLAVPDLDIQWGFVFVAFGMALGGCLDSRNVAETLGKKITSMNAGQGFTANLVTTILVSTASLHALPVSTTHVSVGSLVGLGAATRQARWRTIREIGLAWLATVPCGAILAAASYQLLRLLAGAGLS